MFLRAHIHTFGQPQPNKYGDGDLLFSSNSALIRVCRPFIFLLILLTHHHHVDCEYVVNNKVSWGAFLFLGGDINQSTIETGGYSHCALY